MKQETNAKITIKDALSVIIPNIIIAMYYGVIIEFYRSDMMLLSIPSIICVSIVSWLVIKTKSVVGTWQRRVGLVTGFAIGYFLALVVINFLSYE